MRNYKPREREEQGLYPGYSKQEVTDERELPEAKQ